MKNRNKLRLILIVSIALGALDPATEARAQAGSHGGDACEERFRDITRNLADWIASDEINGLKLPAGWTPQSYRSAMQATMLPYLAKAPHAGVIMGCVNRPVSVDGIDKMCVWRDPKLDPTITDGKIHIECDVNRYYYPAFSADGTRFKPEQYRQTIHEWNSIVNVEPNTGAMSDYSVTDQITAEGGEWVLEYRLVVRKPTPCAKPEPATAMAFQLLKTRDETITDLQEYLSNNPVAKDARNEECETLYFASIRYRNEEDRHRLEGLGYAPADVNTPDEKLKLSAYDYALWYGSVKTIEELRAKGGHRELPLDKPKYELETDFLFALRKNRKDVIEWFLKNGANAVTSAQSALNYCGLETPLVVAARENQSVAVINLLIRNKANVHGGTCPGDLTPLIAATQAGANEAMIALIRAGANVETRDSGYKTPLAHAAIGLKRDTVQLLLEAGARRKVRPFYADEGWRRGEHVEATSLAQYALRTNNVELFSLSIEFDLNPTPVSLDDMKLAAATNSLTMVKYLLQTQNSQQLRDELAKEAAQRNAVDVLQFLIAQGLSAPARDEALLAAARGRSSQNLRLLLAAGVTREARLQALGIQEMGKFADGLIAVLDAGPAEDLLERAFENACGENSIESVKALQKYKPSQELFRKSFVTYIGSGRPELARYLHAQLTAPLDEVSLDAGLCSTADYNLVEDVEFMLKLGADPNAHGRCRSPLWQAATSCNPAIMKLLVDAGANVNATVGDRSSYQGPTVLAQAASHCSYEVLKMLIDKGADRRGGGIFNAYHYAESSHRSAEILELLKVEEKK